ncbi:hypothetical protein OG436_06020 [Streptomyces caniferus]|uniref:hypothetical protein n=1 Tax=Streptomyces caniferus TaxID=285557 RepID=UPI002E2B1265|nr:hypothetical protein [Streptomyces caniferus]
MSLGQRETAAGGRRSQLLDSPVLGMTPWIAMSVLVGPGRYELAVAIALALAVTIVVIGRKRRPGSSFKILEIADVVFFAAMAVIGIVASPGTLRWLENYSGEVSNIALLVISLGPWRSECRLRCSTRENKFLASSGTIPGFCAPITASRGYGVRLSEWRR